MLDRLLDAEPGSTEVPPPTSAQALEQLQAAVRRDLEALLNARRRRLPLPPLLQELPSSLANYGIPDPGSGAYALADMREALAGEVERTIRHFEPRLTRVKVSLAGDVDDLHGTLRLKVDAVLHADPVPEPVSFETVLEPITRDFVVREV